MRAPDRTLWRLDAAGLLVCLGLTLVGWLAILRPLAQDAATLAALRDDLSSAETGLGQLEAARRTRSAHFARLRSELAASHLQLESVDRLNRKLDLLVQHATASGLSIHETRSGAVRSGERFDMVPLQASGTGAYQSCASFLHRVFEHLPDVEVVVVELSGNPSLPGAPSRFRFEFTWYAAPVTTAAAAATP